MLKTSLPFLKYLVKVSALALLLIFPALLKAQDVASMTGIVTDTSGAVLSKVDVTLVNTKTNVTYEAKTDSLGSYRFVNVAPGPGYTATFKADGFTTYTVADIYLNVAATRTQNAVLQVGSTTSTVEVSGSTQNVTIDTTDATIGNNFDVKMVNELPIQVRSSPTVLFQLQPGITNGAVTGARSDQSTTTIDGLDVNDLAAGQSGPGFNIIGNAPVDAVQEFRGTVGGQLSSGGPGGGGQFQMVTKSGTNKFHGNINEYHRDTSTVANDWFNNNAGVRRPPLIRNQFGGNIGGPIKRDKLFFFFDFYSQRIVQSQNVSRVVPLDSFRNGNISYILNGCDATSRQNTTPQCIGTLNSAQVQALDPQGIGFNQSLLTFINQRYPHANDLTGGDGINTGLFRFTTPTPDNTTNYVGRIDYNLTDHQQIFGRFTINRRNATQTAIEFPSDPTTHPFEDRSYAYVVGHTWTIGTNKVNQIEYGDNITKFNFPTTYNPIGINEYDFGISSFLDGPYSDPSSQKRRVPIPVVLDNFNWTVGSHSLVFGGQFKFIKTNSQLVNDFNSYGIGLGGNTNQLNASLRPADIRTAGTTAASTYDNAFALALGRVGSIGSNYNYDNKGNTLPQGHGAVRRYRFYETELYFGDTWKVTPNLTLDYGVRYQLYSVPFEAQGLESVQNTTFDQYFGSRLQQSAAGNSGNSAVPFITYRLGGKANNGPNLYSPSYKDFAPRFAFAYTPSFDRKTVFNGSAGIIFDRTVINAINFIQDQSSYLFQNSANRLYGSSNANNALATDPRIGANLAIPAPPTAPAIAQPYTPFVDDTGTPFGLPDNEFNTIIDPKLKDPYSIVLNFGFQHEFPGSFVLKMNYAGRMGRRLLAQADASQLVDFPDTASGQELSTAFGNMTKQSRATGTVTPQPWFEDKIGPGGTQFLYENLGSYVDNGDFADFVQALAANGLIDANVGMASQFAENTFITNKGSSTYHGLLTTLSKNLSHGLQFDLNYTWSHSIDNTSLVANSIASNTGTGFICDARNLRVCRGNSDFDISNIINGDFLYDLPFGRGRTFAGNAPIWLEELIGGWQLSGIPTWHSGMATSTVSNAFVAGYANNAPAIFNGDRVSVQTHVHKTSSGQVLLFRDQDKARSAFSGPVGFTIGSRNNLRGPSAFYFDAGLGKTFPIVPEKLNLKFRADAFNVLNHPVFNTPSTANSDITSGSFGQITSTVGPTGSTTGNARVAQFSLRLEF